MTAIFLPFIPIIFLYESEFSSSITLTLTGKTCIINLICSFEQDEESFIKITTEGKNALELTKSLLPGLLKLKADTIFKEENSNIVEESSVVTEFIPKDENNYTITCKIVEQNETIFEVSVYAASREKAKQISDNWKSNATTLYPQILELLSNNKDGANINE